MSYNGSGVWVTPTGQPVVTGTVIQSSTFNTLVSDIASTFNNVVTRDGQGPMTAPFKLQSGTVTIPGLSFNSESSTGLFWPSTGILAITTSGIEVARFKADGAVLINTTSDDGVNKLQVVGGASVGTLNVGTTATVGGALTVNGATSLATSATITAPANTNATLALTGSGAYNSIINLGGNGGGSGVVNSVGSSLNLNAPTGQAVYGMINSAIITTTNATGFSVNNSLNVTGNATVGGNTTLSGWLGVTGNAMIGGTLGVTGAVTVNLVGGTANNMTIGATTPSTGVFSTLGVGGTPGGKFSVITGSGLANTPTAWTNYATFGPNAGSNVGAALGLSYNTSAGQSEITSLQPGTSWKPLALFGSLITFNTTTAASEQMRIDGAGNLGLGIVPSSWAASQRAFDISAYGAAVVDTSSNVTIARNGYVGSGWQYKTSNSAQLYTQSSAGQHIWYTAPTGTAGNAITWNQYMTLDASGNLGIGTSSPAAKLDVRGTAATISSTTGGQNISINKTDSGTPNQNGGQLALINLHANNTGRNGDVQAGKILWQFSQPTSGAAQDSGSILVAADGSQGGASTPSYMAFATTGASGTTATERMRLNSVGQVGVGTAPSYLLDLYQASGNPTINLQGAGAFSSVLQMGAAGGGAAQIKSSQALLLFTNGTQGATMDTAQNFTVSGGAPVGKFSVSSASSNAATCAAWNNQYSVFGPNVPSATGASLGLGYNTSSDQAEILALAPSVAWKPLALFASSFKWVGSGNTVMTLDGSSNLILGQTGQNYIGTINSTTSAITIGAAAGLIDGVSRVEIYGTTNATAANTVAYRANTHNWTAAAAGTQLMTLNSGALSVTQANARINLGSATGSTTVYASGSSGQTSFNIDETSSTGYQSYRLGNGTGAPAGQGAALHHMNSGYPTGSGYFPSGTTLTGFGTGGLNLVSQNASGAIRFFVNGTQYMGITSAGVIQDGAGNEPGYKGLPQNAQSSAYTLVATDRGKHVYISAAVNVTVPTGVFNAGDVITVVNGTGSSITLVQGTSTTLYQAGTTNTGNRTILVHGICTLLCTGGNGFFVSGNIS